MHEHAVSYRKSQWTELRQNEQVPIWFLSHDKSEDEYEGWQWGFSAQGRLRITVNSVEPHIQHFYQCWKCWNGDSVVNQQGLDSRIASTSMPHVQILISMWSGYIILGPVTR